MILRDFLVRLDVMWVRGLRHKILGLGHQVLDFGCQVIGLGLGSEVLVNVTGYLYTICVSPENCAVEFLVLYLGVNCPVWAV